MKGKGYLPEDPNKESKVVKLTAVYIVCLVVFLFTFFVFIGPAIDSGCGCMEADEDALFPTIEVALVETSQDDHLMIKHKAGDPIKWSEYKIIITNQSDSEQYTILTDLEGFVTAGEGTIIKASNNPDLARINYESGLAYEVEIYSKKTNQLLWQKINIICY
jgi:hypothetical protein